MKISTTGKLSLSISVLFFALGFANCLAEENMDNGLFLEAADNQVVAVPKEELASWIKASYFLNYADNYNSSIETISFCPGDQILCNLLKTTRENYTVKKVEQYTIDKKRMQEFLEDIARKYNKDPVNATFTIDNNKVSAFSFSENGYKLNLDKSVAKISKFLTNENSYNNTLKLDYDVVEPEIKSEDANKLGIKTLIGEGKSNFKGSTKSRIHNIQVATSRFDGLLIKPGEEFSFVKNLGEVDGEHGYKPELVIKNNVTKPEFGGGICQVSTTVFRAAVYSGLKITARKNHAYPVHYYNPQGFDATIYIPRPDLRFVNNTPGYILIQADIDLKGKNLTFKFYGTDDGRKTEVDGPHILSREPDGSMKTTLTQRVFDSDGKMFIEDTFRSNYASPSKYPHPGQSTVLTIKPKDWSKKQWKQYKKEHGL